MVKTIIFRPFYSMHNHQIIQWMTIMMKVQKKWITMKVKKWMATNVKKKG